MANQAQRELNFKPGDRIDLGTKKPGDQIAALRSKLAVAIAEGKSTSTIDLLKKQIEELNSQR